MATGVLGTVLNDAGVYVWLAATITLISPLAWFWAKGAEMAEDPAPSTRQDPSRSPSKSVPWPRG